MMPSPSDRFSAACGLLEPLTLEVNSPEQGVTPYTFDRPWLVVGRASRSTLCLDDVAVSQRHAYLQVVTGRVFVVDLESRAGLQIDGNPLHTGWVDPGQTLGIGPHQFRLTKPVGLMGTDLTQVVADPIEDRLPRNGSFPLASFDIFEGNVHVARWRLNRVLSLVGRSARCRVRLPDVSVSCVHCSVVATPKGIWVVDLLSREGTRLRGEPVQLARLEEGDTLEVGNYRLRIFYHSGQHRTVSVPASPTEVPAVSQKPPVQSSVVVVRDEPSGGMLAPRATPQLSGAETNALVPLVQQFGVMQQEMFDQFQRTMMMMMQMFTTMHQEQAALLREEMRHFQKATEELNAAQRELRERQHAPQPAPRAAAQEYARPRPLVPEPVKPIPDGPRPIGSWKVGDVSAPSAGLPVQPAAYEKPAVPPEMEPESEDGEEVHDWLTKRIADLESERQSRWKRILGFMRG